MLTWAFERGFLPDWLIRAAIRHLTGRRAQELARGGESAAAEREREALARLRQGPIAVHTDDANRQHYEVPAAFFERVLGKRLKYSCGLWEKGVASLDEAEEAMLALYVARAGLVDGMDILDLGCGWGSLTLYLAARFPASRILAVSNSASQRAFIQRRAAASALANVEAVTADINHFQPSRTFDRVVSIEMFEHMRNYEALLAKVAGCLKPDGRLFVHIFCHRRDTYFFEARDRTDWMARHFFSGGLMPGANLLRHFDKHLRVEEQWPVNGRHYRETSLAWLANMDAAEDELIILFRDVYGEGAARRHWVYWRTFFLTCAEFFGSDGGERWFVSHCRLRPTA